MTISQTENRVSDSSPINDLDIRLKASMQTVVNYLDSEGVFQTKIFNMAEHSDRIAFSKFVIWALNRHIELRVNRVK